MKKALSILGIAAIPQVPWEGWSKEAARKFPLELEQALNEAGMAEGFAGNFAGFVEQAKLTSGSGVIDGFGFSVAISEATAVVGAPFENNASGAAYVFVRSGTSWTQAAKLTATAPAASDMFGQSVSISGDTAVVGARGDDDNGNSSGSAYVFVQNGTSWNEETKLTASDASIGAEFGVSVSIWGNTALIGAAGDSDNGADSGAAYVFVRSGSIWSEEAKLTASDGAQKDNLGASVSLSGDTALLGSPMDDDNGIDSGSAYVFLRSGARWTEETKLKASNGVADDRFGTSVSSFVDRAVVGAPSTFFQQVEGQAYVFVRSGASWNEEAQLTASDGAADDRFGCSVAFWGDTVLVGANREDHEGLAQAGSAYVFAWSGAEWSEEAKLTATDDAAGEQFGQSVSLSEEGALVSVLDDDVLTPESGSVYVYAPLPPPAAYCTAGTSANGCQALLSASGTASATAPSGFTLAADTVEGQKDGLFFFGTNGQQAKSWGNGTSYQCVVPPVVRAGTLSGSGTIGLCDGSFAQDLNALWCPTCPKPAKNPGAGATVQAQLWYRDPLSTSNQTTSLSDAIEFVVGL